MYKNCGHPGPAAGKGWPQVHSPKVIVMVGSYIPKAGLQAGGPYQLQDETTSPWAPCNIKHSLLPQHVLNSLTHMSSVLPPDGQPCPFLRFHCLGVENKSSASVAARC